MGRLAGAVLDAVLLTGMIEGMDEPDPRLALGGPVGFRSGLGRLVGRRPVDELGAVIGKHRVDPVRHRRDQGVEEVGSGSPSHATGRRRTWRFGRRRRPDRAGPPRYGPR
jgi:hypothetical protein